MPEKVYLGDSVYAEFNKALAGDVILTTENGYGPSNTIYLEPEVYNALVKMRAEKRLVMPETTTAPVTTEPTVEECLKEMREMFPRKVVYLERSDYFRLGVNRNDDIRLPRVKLTVPQVDRKYGPPLVVEAHTLSEAMAQVRAHFQEQEK